MHYIFWNCHLGLLTGSSSGCCLKDEVFNLDLMVFYADYSLTEIFLGHTIFCGRLMLIDVFFQASFIG